MKSISNNRILDSIHWAVITITGLAFVLFSFYAIIEKLDFVFWASFAMGMSFLIVSLYLGFKDKENR